MDPLSITAGTIAILGAVAGTGRGISRIIALRHAPQDLQALCVEAQSLRDILTLVHISLLHARASRYSRHYEEHQGALRSVLSSANNVALELESMIEYQLKRSEESDAQGRPKVSRHEWIRAEPEIRRIKDKIRDCRSDLHLGIGALTLQIVVSSQQSTPDKQHILVEEQPHEQIPDAIRDHYALSRQSDSTTSGDSYSQGKQSLQAPATAVDSIALASVSPEDLANQEMLTIDDCEDAPGVSTTPRMLRNVLGQLLLNYTPFVPSKQCDYPPCRRSPRRSQATYYFPAWLASKAFQMSRVAGNLTPYESCWTLRVPIVMPKGTSAWWAVTKGNLESLQTCLSDGRAMPSMIDEDGPSLLHYAVDYMQVGICKFLIELGADSAYENNTGRTPWDIALEKGMTFKLFLDAEDLAVSRYYPPLHLAIALPSAGVALSEHYLEQEYHSINVRDKIGMTPLQWACRRGDIVAVKLLLQWEADVHLQDRRGRSALHHACRSGDASIVNLLLDAGCSVNLADAGGDTPIFYVRGDAPDLIEILVSRGSDVSHCQNHGEAALHSAARYGRSRIIKRLVRVGADINAMNVYGSTPIDVAIFCGQEQSALALLESSKLLKVPLFWSTNRFIYNALHYAAVHSGVNNMKTLAEHDLLGLDPTVRNCRGYSPTDFFYRFRHHNCTILRAPFEQEESAWWTLMESACRQNNIHITAILSSCKEKVRERIIANSSVAGEYLGRTDAAGSSADHVCKKKDDENDQAMGVLHAERWF
ncbi:hypothetical protein LTR37_010041 [Vermiconidia calcicola]|uniref:Uncharacterized protein n=1 Tax=Vermiconidia calcicola TaxID=1690605 RepID=A0ACC3N7K9_9PEZI|nr:hypothetical protein LTR37_010041 [Vermiconidia calcicola]